MHISRGAGALALKIAAAVTATTAIAAALVYTCILMTAAGKSAEQKQVDRAAKATKSVEFTVERSSRYNPSASDALGIIADDIVSVSWNGDLFLYTDKGSFRVAPNLDNSRDIEKMFRPGDTDRARFCTVTTNDGCYKATCSSHDDTVVVSAFRVNTGRSIRNSLVP